MGQPDQTSVGNPIFGIDNWVDIPHHTVSFLAQAVKSPPVWKKDKIPGEEEISGEAKKYIRKSGEKGVGYKQP